MTATRSIESIVEDTFTKAFKEAQWLDIEISRELRGVLVDLEERIIKTICGGTYVSITEFEEWYESGVEDGVEHGYVDGKEEGRKKGHEEGYHDGYGLGHTEGHEEGYEMGHEDGFDMGHEEGYDLGHEEGYDLGHIDGYEDGQEEGYDLGYEEGHEEGFEEGAEESFKDQLRGVTMNKLNLIVEVIDNPEKLAEIAKSMSYSARKKVCKEFEDPYSTFNMSRKQTLNEDYSDYFWTRWNVANSN